MNPETQDTNEPAPPSPGAELEPGQEAPLEPTALGKWLVPFFVIPLIIVVTLALIFLVFGMLTSSERTPRENLDRVRHGGRNDRKQGAFELQRQLQSLDNEKLVLDSRFIPDLMETYKETPKTREDVLIRCWLVAVLGYLGDPQAIPLLKEALDDPGESEESGANWSVRFLAVQALATVGTPEALEPLFEILKTSPDKGMRILAAAGIGRIGLPKNQKALQAALKDSEPEVRWTAAIGLSRFSDKSAIPVLHEMLKSKSNSVWKREEARQESLQLAINALVLLKDRDSIQLLKDLEKDEKNRKVRDFELKGIQKLEEMKD